MKYYAIAVTDDYDNMQFTTTVLTTAHDLVELDFKVNKVCSEWYSEDTPVQVDEDDVWEQPNGAYTTFDGFCEITEDTFNNLKGFLAVL
jgi:hypothetical protein